MKETTLVVAREETIEDVLTAATEIHRELGPGLLESVYEYALAAELTCLGHDVSCQVPVPVSWRGEILPCAFRADIIVDDSLLIEVKAVRETDPIHLAQVITYLKLIRFKRGYLLNFGMALMKDGIKRVSI